MSTRDEKYSQFLAEAVANTRSKGQSGDEEEKKAKVEDLLPEISDELPEGAVPMSKAFAVKKGKSYDAPCRVYSDEDWPESIRMFIPKPIEGYVWPVAELSDFLVGLWNRDRIFLNGVAGTGKSTLAPQVCSILRIPFMRVNCREDMESSALFGSIHVESGTIGWIPGPADILARNGGVLQIDEITASPPGINLAMQWMLEDNGKVFLADKPGKPSEKYIDPVDNFHIVATDNTRMQGDTTGSFAGTQVQNFAMLDRFNTVIPMDYPPNKAEVNMICKRAPEIKKELAEKMVQVANQIRAGFKEGSIQYALSPRGNLEWAWKIAQTGELTKAFRTVYYNKLIDDDRRQVEAYFQRVFPNAKF